MAVLIELNYEHVKEIYEEPTSLKLIATGFVENLEPNFGTRILLQKVNLDLKASRKFLSGNS